MSGVSRYSVGLRWIVILLTLLAAVAPLAPTQTPPVSAAAKLHYLYGSGSATGGKRITLRVELTEPAPSGGAVVTMATSHPSIPVPPSVTVPAGETEREFGITTVPVTVDTAVTVSAMYEGVTKSRVVTILEPYLSSLSVQSKMRAGGTGKIIVRLSGRAPLGGITVNVVSSNPGVVASPGDRFIPYMAASVTIFVHPTYQTQDVPVDFTATYDGRTITRSTIVRWYPDTPTPTGSPTSTATASSTATDVPPTETATASSTATDVPPTETATASSTATDVPPTETATASSTATDVPPTETATASSTATDVPPTETATASSTATDVPPTETPTNTPTETATSTSTATHTATFTATETSTVTSTATNTATATPQMECANPFGDASAAIEPGDRYTTEGSIGYAGCDLTPLMPGPVYASQIENLGFMYDFELGSCGSGSPRFSVYVQGFETYIYIVPGTAIPFTDCGDSGDTGNLMATTAGNCNLANIGGQTYDSCANLAVLAGGNKIDQIFLVTDVSNGPQTFLALPYITINPVGPTETPTNTATATATSTVTDTATSTATNTALPPTNTPTSTATNTATATPPVECPNPSGDVLGSFQGGDVYTSTGDDGYGFCRLSMPTLLIDITEIQSLSVDLTKITGNCGLGSPRFQLRSTSGAQIFVYVGDTPSYTNCADGNSGNVLAGTRCDTSQFAANGGTFYDSCDYDTLRIRLGNAKINRIALVVDGPGQTFVLNPQVVFQPAIPTATATSTSTATNTAVPPTNTPTSTATNTATAIPLIECANTEGSNVVGVPEPGDKYTGSVSPPSKGSCLFMDVPSGSGQSIYWEQIQYLGVDWQLVAGDCGGGNPRFGFRLDGDPANAFFAYVGNGPNGYGCGDGQPGTTGSTGNIMTTTDLRCEATQIGGPADVNCSDLPAILAGRKIRKIFLIVDEGTNLSIIMNPTVTINPVGPTATPTQTNTAVPPTATASPTVTSTPTNTPIPTATNTPQPLALEFGPFSADPIEVGQSVSVQICLTGGPMPVAHVITVSTGTQSVAEVDPDNTEVYTLGTSTSTCVTVDATGVGAGTSTFTVFNSLGGDIPNPVQSTPFTVIYP